MRERRSDALVATNDLEEAQILTGVVADNELHAVGVDDAWKAFPSCCGRAARDDVRGCSRCRWRGS